jgi:hypothetical protein
MYIMLNYLSGSDARRMAADAPDGLKLQLQRRRRAGYDRCRFR